jgi:hypothetical protein
MAAALVLGCSDSPSKATAPQLSGAVVGGASFDRGNDNGNHNGHDNGGHRLAVTLLTGDEEVPPRETDARGSLKLKLSKDGQSIDYVLDVRDISNVTQAHIHTAAFGANGPIVVWLFPSARANAAALPGGGGPIRRLVYEGTFTAADFRSIQGAPPMSMSAFLALVEAGNTYGNVHTEDGNAANNTGPGDFPGGELRGQLGKKHID